MSPPKKVDVDPDEQVVLREWRELIVENYEKDIARLEGMEDSVHGFHVEHALMDEKDTLRRFFHEKPTRALELGFRIMREQFDKHNIPTRPVLRVVGLSKNYLNRVDELRMRDRNDLVSLDVKINEVSHAYGWLKTAVYECMDCETRVEVPQRRARERESPHLCRTCLHQLMENYKKTDIPKSFIRPDSDFSMIVEECNYEDVQDISMSQITYNSEHHLINCSTRNQILGTLTDDLVDQLRPSTYVRVNGIVRVQPVPDRTFSKDTRRLLSIDILSVEELHIEE